MHAAADACMPHGANLAPGQGSSWRLNSQQASKDWLTSSDVGPFHPFHKDLLHNLSDVFDPDINFFDDAENDVEAQGLPQEVNQSNSNFQLADLLTKQLQEGIFAYFAAFPLNLRA